MTLCPTLKRCTSLIAIAVFGFAPALASADAFKYDPDKLTFKESKKIFKDMGDVDNVFEEKKKVLIAGYRVGFMVNGGATALDKGEDTQISNFSGQDRVTYYVDHPDALLSATATIHYDDKLMQEIVEEGYADLQARMKAIGREVVLMDSLKDKEGYKTLELAQPDAKGEYTSSNDNGGLADTNYIAKTPKGMPMWFMAANPLDQGGALSKAADALSMKNQNAWKQLGVDSDAAQIDMTFLVRPAFVYGVRKKFMRPASVGVDPFLVVIPEPIMIQTNQKTWVGLLPKAVGDLRLEKGVPNAFKEAKDYPFNYGYDYATFKMGETVKDTTVFDQSYEKSTSVDITLDRAKFKAAVLNALKVTNATLALWAKENPAD